MGIVPAPEIDRSSSYHWERQNLVFGFESPLLLSGPDIHGIEVTVQASEVDHTIGYVGYFTWPSIGGRLPHRVD